MHCDVMATRSNFLLIICVVRRFMNFRARCLSYSHRRNDGPSGVTFVNVSVKFLYQSQWSFGAVDRVGLCWSQEMTSSNFVYGVELCSAATHGVSEIVSNLQGDVSITRLSS